MAADRLLAPNHTADATRRPTTENTTLSSARPRVFSRSGRLISTGVEYGRTVPTSAGVSNSS
ncbi:hypothetical protein C9J85_09885 [Haloferax sp. wsp5]|nr:hypothetical protein C9J85_09885 [Haloferax sp. wsp5]